MYSYKVEPPDAHFPVINRSMSSDNRIELLPVMTEICRTEFNMINPVAIYMGDNVYHIFEINNPSVYAEIIIINNTS